jgi:hypothetical protein
LQIVIAHMLHFWCNLLLAHYSCVVCKWMKQIPNVITELALEVNFLFTFSVQNVITTHHNCIIEQKPYERARSIREKKL